MIDIYLLKYIIITILPWIELRGAIPLAIKNNDISAIPLIIFSNMLIFFPVYFGMELVYERIKPKSFLKVKLEKTREKVKPYVEKYGVLGLLIFVAIPLPGTGAYAGSAAAWLLSLHWKKSSFAVAGGVLVAGIIVFILSKGIAIGLGS